MADWLVGGWASEPLDSKLGLLSFRFRFGADGQFDIAGTSVDESADVLYRRTGVYVVAGNQWTSAAINDGRPVELSGTGDEILFKIDEKLAIPLRRG